MINRNKSGQVTLILVMVTMIAALGIAVASSSQSKINLKDTVYSTQSSQAVSCAEGGVERALQAIGGLNDEKITSSTDLTSIDSANYDSDPIPDGSILFTSTDGSGTGEFDLEGCNGYTVRLSNYPTDGTLEIQGVTENAVQQLNVEGYSSGESIDLLFKPANTSETAVALAIYQYSDDGYADRRLVSCNAGGLLPASDYENASVNGDGLCVYTINLVGNPKLLRIRPIFEDAYVRIDGFKGSAGYLVDSLGIAGEVERNLQVYTFYSQLPAGMDEAIVSFNETEVLD